MFDKIDKSLKDKIISFNNNSYIDVIVYATSIECMSEKINEKFLK